MLTDAQTRKAVMFKDVRKQELTEVQDLRSAIEKEKKDKKDKKVKQREAAWEVIRENEVEKQRRLTKREEEKAAQNKLIEEGIK